jgi:glycosyltransferase involved in cell wall biosynthesis
LIETVGMGKEEIQVMTPAAKPGLRFFVFAYWHDARFKSKAGGPIKVYELTKNLTKRGHRVYLFIPKIGYPEQQTTAHVCPVPFIDLPILRFISFQVVAFLWALRVALRKDHPDIIYVRIMWSFIPMILGRLLSVPVMLEINDSPHRAYASITNTFKRTVVHLIDKVSFHLSDHLLPVTQKIAENMHTLEGIPWRKLTVLPSGTNIDLFHPMDKRQCCRKLGFDESLTYIGFIGTFFRHQGIDTLIDAAPLIINKYPQVRFLILGDGPMRVAWSQKIDDCTLCAYFLFPGNVPYEEVPPYCGVMDVCVAPFLKEAVERSPVKIFDYLACGKPVVATDVGETSGFFADSGAVMIVPPEDPAALAQGLNSLLENETLRAEMGKKGRAFVTGRYSRAQIAEIVETAARKLLP